MAQRTRAAAACLPCRITKSKCGDKRPCARCQKSGRDMCFELPTASSNFMHTKNERERALPLSLYAATSMNPGYTYDKFVMRSIIRSGSDSLFSYQEQSNASSQPIPAVASLIRVSSLPITAVPLAWSETALMQQGNARMNPLGGLDNAVGMRCGDSSGSPPLHRRDWAGGMGACSSSSAQRSDDPVNCWERSWQEGQVRPFLISRADPCCPESRLLASPFPPPLLPCCSHPRLTPSFSAAEPDRPSPTPSRRSSPAPQPSPPPAPHPPLPQAPSGTALHPPPPPPLPLLQRPSLQAAAFQLPHPPPFLLPPHPPLLRTPAELRPTAGRRAPKSPTSSTSPPAPLRTSPPPPTPSPPPPPSPLQPVTAVTAGRRGRGRRRRGPGRRTRSGGTGRTGGGEGIDREQIGQCASGNESLSDKRDKRGRLKPIQRGRGDGAHPSLQEAASCPEA
jgi:hypothetical protein